MTDLPAGVTQDMILAHAKSDYEFDGRGDWDRSARHDRERYCERVRKGYTAALAGRVLVPREPGDNLANYLGYISVGEPTEVWRDILMIATADLTPAHPPGERHE